MAYKILRADKADDQLNELIQYISMDSGSVEIALNYLQKIEHAIALLAEHPYLGRYPRYSILKKRGYRVLVVEKHLVFYIPNESKKIVFIHAVVDARREYQYLV